MEEELKAAIMSALEDFCQKDAEGHLFVEIYVAYRDNLEDYHLKKILEADDPRMKFYEELYEWYFESAHALENDAVDFVMNNDEVSEFIDEDNEWDVCTYIRDLFMDKVYVKYPEDYFLGQNVYVDIMLDTGDMNYDFTLNCLGPHYAAYYTEGKLPDEASLVWLAKQQGYTKTQLKAALKERPKDSGFLQSVYDELNNSGSHMNTLVFLVEMTFGEYLDLLDALKTEEDLNKSYTPKDRKGRGYLVIDKKVNCGLFDEWSGGGSILELKLDKDVRIPFRYIFKAKPDCCINYNIKSVYGVCNSLWNGQIKQIKTMKRKEK